MLDRRRRLWASFREAAAIGEHGEDSQHPQSSLRGAVSRVLKHNWQAFLRSLRSFLGQFCDPPGSVTLKKKSLKPN